jgi:hypothetical protein
MMFTPQERREMIAKIRELPGQVEAAVRGLNDQQLDTPYGPGKWTPRQVAHHLADSHMNAMLRMKTVLVEDHPTIKTYNQDDWARLHDASALPLESSLSIVRGLQHRMADLLDHVKDADWSRKAMHPERGEITLDDLLKIYSHHGEKHCGQINGLRAAKGW